MQQAQQAVPNAACGRSSNSKSLGANTSAPLTSIDQSSDVLRSHKDDYQHWTHVRPATQFELETWFIDPRKSSICANDAMLDCSLCAAKLMGSQRMCRRCNIGWMSRFQVGNMPAHQLLMVRNHPAILSVLLRFHRLGPNRLQLAHQ